MEVIPAIDIKNGQVVRLNQGDPDFTKSYAYLGSPAKVAEMWKNEGAGIIHIVDLDSAMGLNSNLSIIKEIIQNLEIAIQVGGGIRNYNVAKDLFDIGVMRVIIGTLAFSDEDILLKLLKDYGKERIIISLDHYGRDVKIKGWKESSNMDIKDALIHFCNLGVNIFLITSIKRDGMLTSPDYHILKELLEFKVNIIAAGGISKLDHVVKLKEMGMKGVIIGKALYENKFTLKNALKIVENNIK